MANRYYHGLVCSYLTSQETCHHQITRCAVNIVYCSLISDNPKGAARLAFPELSAIESTAVLHFGFAVKQDQELGLQLLKHMKSGKAAFLSSFSLTCLMTMARIHRFEDNVMDYLKSSTLSVFKDAERMKRETWVTGKQWENGCISRSSL